MDIHSFTEIMNQAESEQKVRLNRYATNVQDIRFGIRDTYVAASFEQNGTSTVMEFRVGDIKRLIEKFNSLPGVSARPHTSSKNMFEVRINNVSFTDDVIALINICASRAVSQYRQRR